MWVGIRRPRSLMKAHGRLRTCDHGWMLIAPRAEQGQNWPNCRAVKVVISVVACISYLWVAGLFPVNGPTLPDRQMLKTRVPLLVARGRRGRDASKLLFCTVRCDSWLYGVTLFSKYIYLNNTPVFPSWPDPLHVRQPVNSKNYETLHTSRGVHP